ncbi:MAG: hypothetical protein V1899_09825, partial [Planctomycetota bacterium]
MHRYSGSFLSGVFALVGFVLLAPLARGETVATHQPTRSAGILPALVRTAGVSPALVCTAGVSPATVTESAAVANQPIGSGDGLIHVIPTLSAPSVKNGGKLTVSVIVKSQAGVKEVVADLGGVETMRLQPSSGAQGGISLDGTLGLWSGEWKAHSLEEKIYSVCVRVVDRNGHVFEDRSLSFSDPAAGLSAPGNTTYPDGGQRRIGAAGLVFGESGLICSVIDTTNGYAYFGTYTEPGIVVKVALGGGGAAPARVGAVTLNAGENRLYSAAIDAANGYAYFGTDTAPGIVVKVAWGGGGAATARVGAVT